MQFYYGLVKYLGQVIRPIYLLIGNARVTSLKEPKQPKTQTELYSFLGFCNVYRRIIPRFAKISRPLNERLKKVRPPNLETLAPVQARGS